MTGMRTTRPAAGLWPHRILGYQATGEQAGVLAAEIVDLLGQDPWTWLDLAGFEVKDEPFVQDFYQGLCLPMTKDRFRFVIYAAEIEPNEQRRTFILCHEIAHTFFYYRRAGTMPTRAVRIGSDWEEEFCDSFALAATGLTELPEGLPHLEKRAAA